MFNLVNATKQSVQDCLTVIRNSEVGEYESPKTSCTEIIKLAFFIKNAVKKNPEIVTVLESKWEEEIEILDDEKDFLALHNKLCSYKETIQSNVETLLVA